MEEYFSFEHLLPPSWEKIVDFWIQEDVPYFDYGGFVVGEDEIEAFIYQKTDGVLAGVPFVNEIFRRCGCQVTWNVNEGAYARPSETDEKKIVIAVVKGQARKVLIGERIALNVLGRASGIATLGHDLNDLKRQHGWHGVFAGTRKTTPGFRLVEKYAMLVGGMDTHRMDLSSMVLLKHTHLHIMHGDMCAAIARARRASGFTVRIGVECTDEQSALDAIAHGADVVLLDNLRPAQLQSVAHKLRTSTVHSHPSGSAATAKIGSDTTEAIPVLNERRKFLIEGSGGVTTATCAAYFSRDVDILSLGSASQGVPIVDFSLAVRKSIAKS